MASAWSLASLDPVEQLRARRYFYSEPNLADFVMGLEEEGLADVSYQIVSILVNQFESMPGRREFIDRVMIPENEDGHNFRSDDLYRRLVGE